ncbi:MAG: hypothetical protein COV07_03565 [Candidatus Vogelbacteria bacterium CG10_big_fil_rev_8_21_14_0_10_45_14]|uniref:Uncharacterized protein n=1 Tax=Candidatus Vogelbacteria bacterium CG10_big_fil_rev_8_21_14_0_10_45_14 TaxID=1975042 RepID=A0A2H0RJ44_9BACT|nr:MAG: hypothetical protein COV07_03565 [Candidatus Vogelbacteria bacterium CG10_big_fil_rev_8_21_14_0_10_45_14]
MKWLLILAIGIILGLIFSRRHSKSFNDEQTENKENNKRKILELLNTKHQITNNDVENSLEVSDATAERYLNELEKEGKVKQVDRTGKHVYYEKV